MDGWMEGWMDRRTTDGLVSWLVDRLIDTNRQTDRFHNISYLQQYNHDRSDLFVQRAFCPSPNRG